MEITVLLVEDSNIQLKALQGELKEKGWNIVYAQDKPAADICGYKR